MHHDRSVIVTGKYRPHKINFKAASNLPVLYLLMIGCVNSHHIVLDNVVPRVNVGYLWVCAFVEKFCGGFQSVSLRMN